MKSKTVKQLREYCKTHNIRGYSRLRKNDLIDFIIDQMRRKEFISTFNFQDDYFPEKRIPERIQCEICGEYYKPSYIKNHLRSTKHKLSIFNDGFHLKNIEKYLKSKTKSELLAHCKNQKIEIPENLNKSDLIQFIINLVQRRQLLNLFPFDKDLFSPSKKPRKKQIKCDICGGYYKDSYKKQHSRSLKHRNALLISSEEVIEVDESFKSRLKTYWIMNINGTLDLKEFLYVRRKEIVKNLIKENLEKRKHLKVNLRLFCDHTRGTEIKETETTEHSFKTMNSIIVKHTDLNDFYACCVEKLLIESDDFESRGSGWSLNKIKYLELAINKYDPLKGSSYVDLPKELKNKKAIVNVKNKDNKCFMWSVLSGIHPAEKNCERITKYKKYENELNFKGIDFPVSLDKIKKFEKMNNISVNVYGYEKNEITVLLYSENKLVKHVNLLYIKDAKKDHYCWIKSMSRLLRAQMGSNQVYWCDRCLNRFTYE